MAIGLTSNLEYNGSQPNFSRDIYDSLETMKGVSSRSMPKMFMASCLETGKVYLYNRNNEADPVTGQWREIGSSASDVSVSEETGNILVNKDDGLFVPGASVSEETGNILVNKDDGLFVKADGENIMVKPDADKEEVTLNTALSSLGGVKTVSTIEPDADGNVDVFKILTQEEYDALAEKTAGVVYLIKE